MDVGLRLLPQAPWKGGVTNPSLSIAPAQGMDKAGRLAIYLTHVCWRQKEKERLYLRGPMDDKCLLQTLAERIQQAESQDARESRHRDGAKEG
jgi:hypothetical protein